MLVLLFKILLTVDFVTTQQQIQVLLLRVAAKGQPSPFALPPAVVPLSAAERALLHRPYPARGAAERGGWLSRRQRGTTAAGQVGRTCPAGQQPAPSLSGRRRRASGCTRASGTVSSPTRSPELLSFRRGHKAQGKYKSK